MVKRILRGICFTIISFCFLSGCANIDNAVKVNNAAGGKDKIKIIDIKTGKEIEADSFRFIITDLNKEFMLSKKNNAITEEYKKPSKASEYPYGYTTVTSVKGYYPRIDRNLKLGGNGDAEYIFELTPIGELQNSSFTEVFHGSSDVEMVEFLNHYNLSEIN